ncbi:MAG: hypothetical protein H6740_15090 [Alphaproteobacteria bacterium]|nr:hypothetical protein [Alphaproteobacteria bacterium]
MGEAELAGFVHRHRPELEHLLAAAGFVQRLRVTWYASGTNHPGEVRGWASIGAPIGVSVTELGRPGTMAALEVLAGTGVRVFVDSGAFSETEETPITPAGWRWRMEVYARLARALGPQLALVAPDRVGDPEESARRLERWAPRLHGLIDVHGVELIVPLQRGRDGLLGSWHTAQSLLQRPFTLAIPGNKAAATDAEVADLLREAQPERLHVLGMGPRNRRAPGLLALVALYSPLTVVSMDSNRRRAAVGRSWAAPLTRAEDAVGETLGAWSRMGERLRDAEDGFLPDYTDEIAEPSVWMSKAARRRVAREVLPRGLRGRFVVEPEGLLTGTCGEDERPRWCVELEDAVERAWDAMWARATVAERKARGIRRAHQHLDS